MSRDLVNSNCGLSLITVKLHFTFISAFLFQILEFLLNLVQLSLHVQDNIFELLVGSSVEAVVVIDVARTRLGI